MFKKKNTPYYKKYYLFGKCIWKHQKSIKQVSEYLLSEIADMCLGVKQNVDKNIITTQHQIDDFNSEIKQYVQNKISELNDDLEIKSKNIIDNLNSVIDMGKKEIVDLKKNISDLDDKTKKQISEHFDILNNKLKKDASEINIKVDDLKSQIQDLYSYTDKNKLLSDSFNTKLNTDIKRIIEQTDDNIKKLQDLKMYVADGIYNVYEKTNNVKISDNKLICDGVYKIEGWGAWLQKSANIYLTFDKHTNKDVELRIMVSKLDTKNHPTQELIVFVNGEYNSNFVTDKKADDVILKIPFDQILKNNFKTVLSFLLTNQISPSELGINNDTRKLSYGLVSVSANTDIILSAFDSKYSYKLKEDTYKTSFLQKQWNDYLDDDKLKNLCHNLSQNSIDVINTLLYRRQNEYSFSTDELYQKHLAYTNDISKYKIVNKSGFQPEVFYFKNGLKFLDEKTVKKYLSNGCIIDGGACSGDSALMFSEYDFVKKIYAFEPLSGIYADMAKTLKVNNCTKAEAVNMGLSDTDGISEIMGEKCKTVTIDTFAKDKTVSCIKLDVEGMEFNVIKGALQTIKRDKPLLLICMYHTPKDFFEIKPLIESLNLGYKFKVVDTEPCNKSVGVHAMLIGYKD